MGASREEVTEDVQRQAAEQVFRVLGDLKGGAMKVGQALSLVETALPEETAAPYRDHLRRLQEAAPPMPLSRVHAVLDRELGTDWRDRLTQLEPRPAAAASIGQVHRAVWAETGQQVAVKIQYPGAEEALRSDLKQLAKLGTVLSPLSGGVEVKPLIAELTERVSEEVDYRLEAAAQAEAAAGFADDPEFKVPQVFTHTARVLVSEWIDGVPLSAAVDFPDEERNAIALRYVRFLFAGPARVGLLHCDPHPGNFRVLADGRLGILDFGAVLRLPDGLPPEMGRLMRLCAAGDAETVRRGLVELGFVSDKTVSGEDLIEFLSPFVEPAIEPEFHFTRDWMRHQATRVQAASRHGGVGARLNLPPEFLMLERVWLGGVAVLSQLDVRAPFGDVLTEFLPGWAPGPE